MAGLAGHLGVVRMTLWGYRKRAEPDDPLLPVLARALNRIADWTEEALYTREASTGARFALEVNHGYGREMEEAADDKTGSFNQIVIAPADETSRKAVPKWKDS